MILVFGGSFDPPHLGHLNIVKVLKEKFSTAYKIFIYPNAISPFKIEKSLDRDVIWELCQLTFQETLDSQTELIETELRANDTSYTVTSIKNLQNQFPEEQIWLCIGEDSLNGLPSWHRFSELDQILEGYVILRRKTRSPFPIHFPNDILQNKSIVLDNDLWEISSTRLRDEREWEYAKHWMRPVAFDYLKSKGWFESYENN
jgi:nicotinate-nucleotide adenylyltransferase